MLLNILPQYTQLSYVSDMETTYKSESIHTFTYSKDYSTTLGVLLSIFGGRQWVKYSCLILDHQMQSLSHQGTPIRGEVEADI